MLDGPEGDPQHPSEQSDRRSRERRRFEDMPGVALIHGLDRREVVERARRCHGDELPDGDRLLRNERAAAKAQILACYPAARFFR